MNQYKSHKFPILKSLDLQTHIYELNYTKAGLRALETFDHGKCVFANKIQIQRYYIDSSPAPNYEYFTRVEDLTREKKRASICLVHDFARSSDSMMELAI